MAGIGFELKKIFKEESISRTVMGVGYSTVITLGPTFSIMASVLALYLLFGFLTLPYTERGLLSSTILYIFIFSVILTAPFNSVFSRYIADKIYEEKFEDILPSFYTGFTLCTALGSIIAIPFAWRLITIGGAPVGFVILTYFTFLTIIIVLFSMIYLHATKDYRIITYNFIGGMITGILVALLIYHFRVLNTSYCVLVGLEIGLFIIAILQFAYLRRFFQRKSNNYLECLTYLWKHKYILLSNLFYTVGMYISNFVFWSTPMKNVAAKSYYSMQSFDMASFLAVFTNISIMIIFTVIVETKFHDKYQMYNRAVVTATLEEIRKYQRSMFRLLVQQMNSIISIQAIISMILFLLIVIFLPDYGFGGMTMTIYPALAAAFFVIFIMYCNIVFLYYFNDNKGAFYTSLSFLVTAFVGSLAATHFSIEFFGAGAFLGAIIGWTVSHFRIHYLEKNFERHIFCNKLIVTMKKGKKPNEIMYQRNNRESEKLPI